MNKKRYIKMFADVYQLLAFPYKLWSKETMNRQTIILPPPPNETTLILLKHAIAGVVSQRFGK